MGTPMKDRHVIKLTDAESAELEAIREQFQAERPGPSSLVDRGEIDEPIPHGQFVELLSLVDQIKRAREQGGVSITDLSQQSGLTRAAISRLENGWNNNPTLDTLYRYALAAGMHIKLTAEPVAKPSEPDFVEKHETEQHPIPPGSDADMSRHLIEAKGTT
ncbi:helix-turn-helix transcriptional regulator [Singulisphaera sp. Ch08]|uniref:Helix-turn-helix transcriptional regulator n=1 Tax=Singulisphaera sp. Ch08 TaxID=3120278 RepID=A0AAU7C9T3_9BACT